MYHFAMFIAYRTEMTGPTVKVYFDGWLWTY